MVCITEVLLYYAYLPTPGCLVVGQDGGVTICDDVVGDCQRCSALAASEKAFFHSQSRVGTCSAYGWKTQFILFMIVSSETPAEDVLLYCAECRGICERDKRRSEYCFQIDSFYVDIDAPNRTTSKTARAFFFFRILTRVLFALHDDSRFVFTFPSHRKY